MKHLFSFLTQLFCRDITDLKAQNQEIIMKLDAIKAQVAEAAKNSKEAFAELSQRLADQQAKIDQLIADASNPDVTDEAFLADLQTVSDNNKALAEIVPNPVEPPVA